jgi:phosphoglucomutase
VQSPNPEENGAFEYAIIYGNRVQADLLLATDPDADRLGVAIRNQKNEYTLLNGNQIGALILYYIAQYKPRLRKGIVFNTIVSSNIASEIAKEYNLEVRQTLTGFKYIGEQAKRLENSDEEFFFGYEESHGYVIADFVRDKDAFQALVMLAEMTAFYKERQKSLLDVLEEIYQTFGYFVEIHHSITLSGIEGTKRIQSIMNTFKHMSIIEVAGQKIKMIEDFEDSKRFVNGRVEQIQLPQSQVLKYTFENGGWFVLRPSGTEPKMKVYASCKGSSYLESFQLAQSIKQEILDKISKI